MLNLDLVLTDHAKERLDERNITTGDILHIIRTGFVYDAPQPASRDYYKYAIEGRSPNSNGRTIKLIIIPDVKACGVKLITIMWKDKT
ncbi:DUF4258 domain-containing protein [Litorimonas sp.]|uniref:DUF4258 domain-containing protein n=1 Tax=Litorimonas sp. TaxID=1892381 RepID=UPI003A869564